MQIIIPTYQRLHAQKTLEAIPAKFRDRVTLVVRREELKAAAKLDVDLWALPKSISTISATRAQVGKLAEQRGYESFLMLDDDLRLFQRGADLKLTPLVKWGAMLAAVARTLKEVPSVSLSIRFGNQWVEQSVKYLQRQTQATAYRTDVYNKLVFGRSNYFEDTERTLQLFAMGYKNAVLYDYAIEPGRMNTPGGCSTFRTVEGMREDALSMAARWPGVVEYVEKPDPKFFPCGSPRPEVKPSWRKAYKP